MSEDDEWSYGVGEFDDEDEPDEEAEDSVRSPEAAGADEEAEDDDGWRFSLEDVEENEDEEDEEEGWLNLSAEVEAGSPELENVVFVLLGVTLGVAVAVQLFF